LNKDRVVLEALKLCAEKVSPAVFSAYIRNIDRINGYYGQLTFKVGNRDNAEIWNDISLADSLGHDESELLQKISSTGMILTMLDSFALNPIGSTDIRMLIYLSLKITKTMNELKKVNGGMGNAEVRVKLSKPGVQPLNNDDLLPMQEELAKLPLCLFDMLSLYVKMNYEDLSIETLAGKIEEILSGKYSGFVFNMVISLLSGSEEVMREYDGEFEKFIVEKSNLPEFNI
jgi:hypothetical protein